MKKKSDKKIEKRVIGSHPVLSVLKLILALLTVVFPGFMVISTGAGLIYNRESYGAELTRIGAAFIVSSVMMLGGTLLVCLKKNISAVISSAGGFAICMIMLCKLADHADRSGWSDKYTMAPVSNMYISRIIPVIAPFLLTAAIAMIQYFSYEAAEKRREKRRIGKEKENAPAPPIV